MEAQGRGYIPNACLFSGEFTHLNCIFPIAYATLTWEFQRKCPMGLRGHDMHTSFCLLIGSCQDTS